MSVDMKKILSILFFVCLVSAASAARIDTVEVHSAAMQRGIPALVVVPEAAPVGSGAADSEVPVGAASAAAGAVALAAPGAAASGN